MTWIGLIRHGVTDWNYEHRAQGQTDIPLNDEGRRQAELLSRRMENEDWDCIYSSDLSRALETAEIIGSIKNIEVRTDQRLREMNCGLIEGTTEQDRVNKWGYGWSKLDLGIESNDEIMTRGMKCIMDISERHPSKKILIVSHGALIGLTLKKLIPHIDTQEQLHNTSVTVLNKDEFRWDCERYNCITHIENDKHNE
ncbi:putative phosphoglycerate mutase [Paenibacillus anaericanus]|uniref:histidine phosphatase family protein n=1 Tax=Paenibacillus anaericanus TaxID=170367 RepID=UPI002787391D|nr:histidine phosphatase family protein [Paenibacillus anaericanus]MDQ0092024.1 putative phosphoglycerate mutase [Paenibacillus anaericanus]